VSERPEPNETDTKRHTSAQAHAQTDCNRKLIITHHLRTPSLSLISRNGDWFVWYIVRDSANNGRSVDTRDNSYALIVPKQCKCR